MQGIVRRGLVWLAATLGLIWLAGRLLGSWRCPVLLWWNIPCPTCGMLTALQALRNGHLLEAWQSNPLVYPFLGYYLYLSYLYIVGRLGRINPQRHLFILLAVLLGYGLLRWFVL